MYGHCMGKVKGEIGGCIDDCMGAWQDEHMD